MRKTARGDRIKPWPKRTLAGPTRVCHWQDRRKFIWNAARILRWNAMRSCADRSRQATVSPMNQHCCSAAVALCRQPRSNLPRLALGWRCFRPARALASTLVYAVPAPTDANKPVSIRPLLKGNNMKSKSFEGRRHRWQLYSQ
jgi:hypothetical protein